MFIAFENLTPSQRYFAITQALIPRPIAWVLTDNGRGDSYNLAPFSFFTAICSDPPLLLISCGKKTSGTDKGQFKDTVRNIQHREHFVVHIANTEQLDAVNRSSATLEHGVSEVTEQQLPLSDLKEFRLPRLTNCHVAFGCQLYRLDEIGNTPQAVIYGEIKVMYVDDQIVVPNDQGRLILDAQRIDPLARLGGSGYSALGDLLSADRPL